MPNTLADYLWGKHARVSTLFFAAVLLLFLCLGQRELWTQEHRWADTVSLMFAQHDFLHPFLGEQNYYDKPLLSYWLIAGFAKLTGTLTTAILRLPSALSGLLAIFSIYWLGSRLKDRTLGLLAGWMLLTTFYFLFWARTSSADMLNLAGTLFAVAWYVAKKSSPNFFNYLIFFLILAITALCKGLVGPVVAVLAVLTDCILQRSLTSHLRLSVILAALPALALYILPFWASAHFNNGTYQENGLSLVWRENVVRYFHPFDHKGPIYTYLIFLPIYLLPWTLFFIPAIWQLKHRWRHLSMNTKWLAWTTAVLFLFFTLSGSRRNYYILPVVPFALLFTAEWLLESQQRLRRAGQCTLMMFIALFSQVAILQPIYYAKGGAENFAAILRQTAESIRPWSTWKFVLLDSESKVSFYLGLPSNTHNHSLNYNLRDNPNLQTADLLAAWPFLKNVSQQHDTIYITRQQYLEKLQPLFKDYRIVTPEPGITARFGIKEPQQPIAFLPSS